MNIELTEDQKNKIYSDKELYNVMRNILLRDEEYDQSKEHFWCVGLGVNSILMYIELVSLGSLRKTVVEPMDVFSWAVQKRVDRVILVHNHSSKELRPSAADLDLTDRLIQVGRILNIPVVEHLIITLKDYYSFYRGGDIARLKKSKKYVPGYLEVERIQKEGQRLGEEIGMEKGIDKRNKEMAKMMKKKGEAIEKILEYTGLSKSEIENL